MNRFARVRQTDPDEIEAGVDDQDQTRPRVNKWGARGVSIRADDTLDQRDQARGQSLQSHTTETEPLTDPDHFLSDEENDAPAIDVSAIDPNSGR